MSAARLARTTDADWDRRLAQHFAVSRIVNHAFPLAMACARPKGRQPPRAPPGQGDPLMNPLTPTPSLLSKLGSIAVHADELMSPDGHSFDRVALTTVLHDAEVTEWLTAMGALAMVPLKRVLTPAATQAVQSIRLAKERTKRGL